MPRCSIVLLALTAFAIPALAADIEGVLPASLDQPRVYLAVQRDAGGPPLSTAADGGADMLAALLGEKRDKNQPPERVFAVEAFLDTGASGTMLAKATADALGIKPAKVDGRAVKFFDVGIAGEESFGVTEPLRLRVGEYSGRTDGSNLEAYSPAGAPAHLKIRAAGGILEAIGGALDIAGMPVMAGRVMVVDCRPLTDFDKLRTRLLSPNDPAIPKADARVPLTMVDFGRFTRTEPAGAPPTDHGPNPMIGPDPFAKGQAGGRAPAKPVVITHRGRSANLSMLLDTGAAATIISAAKARELGIAVDDAGRLRDVPPKERFSLPIGGIGGAADVPGCYLDSLQLPVAAGEPIRYVKAPVLVKDITVTDAKTGETFTLDGVLGMNYLVASANVTGGLLGGVDDIHDGAFSFFTVDFANSEMGLKLK